MPTAAVYVAARDTRDTIWSLYIEKSLAAPKPDGGGSAGQGDDGGDGGPGADDDASSGGTVDTVDELIDDMKKQSFQGVWRSICVLIHPQMMAQKTRAYSEFLKPSSGRGRPVVSANDGTADGGAAASGSHGSRPGDSELATPVPGRPVNLSRARSTGEPKPSNGSESVAVRSGPSRGPEVGTASGPEVVGLGPGPGARQGSAELRAIVRSTASGSGEAGIANNGTRRRSRASSSDPRRSVGGGRQSNAQPVLHPVLAFNSEA